MLKYMLWRLLLILPAVWLISSVVFLVSRLIPGTYADNYAEMQEGLGNNAGKAMTRSAHLKALAATGHDKPLFYFSVRPQAQPDTLQRVFPVQHQKFLQTLISTYGNWPLISAYYKKLLALQKESANLSPEVPHYRPIQEQTTLLFRTTEPEKVKIIFSLLNPNTGHHEGSWLQALFTAEERFNQLTAKAKPYQNLWPDFYLNGLNNQYHSWFKSFLKINWGYSLRDAQPVMVILKQAIQNTLLLLISSLILVFALGIELSLLLSRRKNSCWRQVVLPTLYVLESIPLFIIALFVLILLAGTGYLSLFPLFGLGSVADGTENWFFAFGDRLYHLLLPILCLVVSSLPYVTTQFYQALQQVLASEYITTARSKGLSEKKVLRRHAFRNILLPVITLFTGYLPALVSGAIVIEVIFAIPGTGRLLAESVLARDYPVVMGLVLFVATLKAVSHLLADFLYFTADPRTRQKIT